MTGVLEVMALAALLWINDQPELERVDPHLCCPDIAMVGPEVLVRERFFSLDDYLATDPEEIARQEQSVMAIYQHDNERILLRDDFDVLDVNHQVVILHEMVHWVQFETGEHEEVACHRELERDAYNLQRRWLKEQGVEPWPNRLTIHLRSQCH